MKTKIIASFVILTMALSADAAKKVKAEKPTYTETEVQLLVALAFSCGRLHAVLNMPAVLQATENLQAYRDAHDAYEQMGCKAFEANAAMSKI